MILKKSGIPASWMMASSTFTSRVTALPTRLPCWSRVWLRCPALPAHRGTAQPNVFKCRFWVNNDQF